ncbi:MAG: hypothetical protein Q4P23_10475 [Micrococcaceae bacterium]|nr:hypothetical protein [Micrococcaceae bacterium]
MFRFAVVFTFAGNALAGFTDTEAARRPVGIWDNPAAIVGAEVKSSAPDTKIAKIPREKLRRSPCRSIDIHLLVRFPKNFLTDSMGVGGRPLNPGFNSYPNRIRHEAMGCPG